MLPTLLPLGEGRETILAPDLISFSSNICSAYEPVGLNLGSAQTGGGAGCCCCCSCFRTIAGAGGGLFSIRGGGKIGAGLRLSEGPRVGTIFPLAIFFFSFFIQYGVPSFSIYPGGRLFFFLFVPPLLADFLPPASPSFE